MEINEKRIGLGITFEQLKRIPCCCQCAGIPTQLQPFPYTPIGWNVLFAILGHAISYAIQIPTCGKCSRKANQREMIAWIPIAVPIGILFVYFILENSVAFTEQIPPKMLQDAGIYSLPLDFLGSLLVVIVFAKKKPFMIKRVHSNHTFDIAFRNPVVHKQFLETIK